MKEINFLKPTKTGVVLDIGSYDGRNFPPLLDFGYKIISVEKSAKWCDHIKKQYPSIELHEMDITDFEIKPKSYDAILCHNVFPFVDSKENVIKVIESCIKGLKHDGSFWFTVFGENDGWAKEVVTFSFDEVMYLLERFSDKIEIVYKASEDGLGASMDGEIKSWNIHSFLIRCK